LLGDSSPLQIRFFCKFRELPAALQRVVSTLLWSEQQISKNKRSFYFSSGPEWFHEQQPRIPNRHRRFALQEQGRWLALQRLCQHVLDQLLQMRGAQAQGIGRFQDDDQPTHVHVRGLHAPKVCVSFAAIVALTPLTRALPSGQFSFVGQQQSAPSNATDKHKES
jgi:hypothetical protein